MTFHELVEKYVRGYLHGRASQPFYLRLHAQYFAAWTEHPTRAQIRQWHRDHAATPAHSNKGLGFLKACYTWAINEELWDQDNPASGIRRHGTQDRERTLSGQEVRLLMNSTDFMYWKFRGVLLMLLMTGCRLSEALKAEWSHVNIQGGIWLKPTTKNGTSQRVPLPRPLCAALARHRLRSTGQFIFAGAYGRHLSRAAAEKSWWTMRTLLKMEDVRLHDFRRTVGTRLHEQGESRELIKSILNHRKKAADPTDIYVRVSFDRQAVALQKHAESLEAMVMQDSPVVGPSVMPGKFPGVCQSVA
jgi:integrase